MYFLFRFHFLYYVVPLSHIIHWTLELQWMPGWPKWNMSNTTRHPKGIHQAFLRKRFWMHAWGIYEELKRSSMIHQTNSQPVANFFIAYLWRRFRFPVDATREAFRNRMDWMGLRTRNSVSFWNAMGSGTHPEGVYKESPKEILVMGIEDVQGIQMDSSYNRLPAEF